MLSVSVFAAADSTAIAAARALAESGKLKEAQEAFEQLAATDPKNAEINFHLGEFALLRNDPGKAVTFYEAAVNAAPKNSLYHHRLGDAYGRSAQQASIFRALGLARKCLAAFQRAVALDPANVAARYSLFTFYRSAPGIIGGGAEKAATEAAAIKKLDPDRGRVAFAALYAAQKKYAKARAELAEVRPLDLRTVQGNSVYLSDVEWTSAAVGWGEPARNYTWFDEHNDSGVVLLVHGRLYAKGLYAHSPSRYTFRLDGKWKVFTAVVGLRDGAHAMGSAVFIVRCDGRELFRSRTLRVDESESVRLDVTDVQELELVTEPTEQHKHFSWANWADPVLGR
jgi:tetratricopeptide (TPR) repeat protein